uniref:Proliferating cell nuclear antigen n=1 Tax=Dulem virus 200 TaxID=3145677 RepID=A0AAU8AYX1_9VIRU
MEKSKESLDGMQDKFTHALNVVVGAFRLNLEFLGLELVDTTNPDDGFLSFKVKSIFYEQKKEESRS